MESNKIQDFFVKLKESAKKHKKLLITSVSALVLGVGLGSLATVSDDVYEANNNDIETVQSQIEEENYVLDNTKSAHDELTAKKEELSYNSKSLDSKIVSLNKEISTILKIVFTAMISFVIGVMIITGIRQVDNTQNVTVVNKKLDSIKNEDKELKEDIEDLKSDIENLEKDIEEKEGKVEELQNVSNSYN